MTPRIGDTIAGRYELRDKLRECASRYVYRAFDLEVEVEVALWWMRSSLFADESQREAFEARVVLAKAVKHPHLIRVFEVGRYALEETQEPGVYVALQLGTSAELEEGLQAGRSASEGNFLRYAEGLVAAVQGAHDAQQVHGLLTPADVVEVASQVKLCGVGLFGFLQPTKAHALWGQESRYLAPELADGHEPRPAADWYSVAAILLELALGKQVNDLRGALAELGEFSPLRCAALSLALRAEPTLRGTGAELIAAIRDAWQDPLGEEYAEEEGALPTVIDDQGRSALVRPLDVPTPAEALPVPMDVGVISFLGDDGEEEKTLLHESQLPMAPPRSPPATTPYPEKHWAGEGGTREGEPEATIVEDSPDLKLNMLSSKPATPFSKRAQKQEARFKSPMRPVLRPLSSLATRAPSAEDLGTFAPPKADNERTGYWLYLLIAMVLGALCVSAALVLAG